MVTESPPVSPKVVAMILMIQNSTVTSGTLLRFTCFKASFMDGDLPFNKCRVASRYGTCRCRVTLLAMRPASRPNWHARVMSRGHPRLTLDCYVWLQSDLTARPV